MGLSMADVKPEDAGLASGLIGTIGEVGAALGLAVLATLSATRTDPRPQAGPRGPDQRLPLLLRQSPACHRRRRRSHRLHLDAPHPRHHHLRRRPPQALGPRRRLTPSPRHWWVRTPNGDLGTSPDLGRKAAVPGASPLVEAVQRVHERMIARGLSTGWGIGGRAWGWDGEGCGCGERGRMLVACCRM